MKRTTKEWWIQWGNNIWEVRSYIIRAFLVFIAVIAANLFFLYFGAQSYDFINLHLKHDLTRILIGCAVFLFGYMASVVRRKRQSLYGNIEAIFGLVSGFTIAWHLPPSQVPFDRWLALMGCIYIVASGRETLYDAEQKKRKVKDELRSGAAKSLPV